MKNPYRRYAILCRDFWNCLKQVIETDFEFLKEEYAILCRDFWNSSRNSFQ